MDGDVTLNGQGLDHLGSFDKPPYMQYPEQPDSLRPRGLVLGLAPGPQQSSAASIIASVEDYLAEASRPG